MKGSVERGCPRPLTILAAAALLVACEKQDPPTIGAGSAAEAKIAGAEAWLVEPAAFKSVGTRTVCTLARVANNPRRSTGYFGLNDSVALSEEEAVSLYGCAKAAMATNYGKAGVASAAGYQSWTNYATTPYVSATHAERYVNNYANDVAAAGYGAYESVGRLPVGSVVVKDSFSVTADGRVEIGPLFMMEKVAHVSGESHPSPWRFTMIMPDGWVFGTTGGQGDANVAFCADCHGTVADVHDSLFFLPPQYRR